MQIDRQTHWQFLNDELRAETEEFTKKFEAKASFLLNESEEMFVGKFVSFKNGEMIVLFPNTRAIPRKGEFLFCMLLPKDLANFHNWNDQTYEDLYKERYKGTECSVIWQAPSDDPRLTLVGFRRTDLEFQQTTESTPGMFLVFAPQMPPTAYMANLQKVVNNMGDDNISKILDRDYQINEWEPTLIKESDASNFILRQLELTNIMILQGPPGTGKTTLIANICSKLINEGKSVLVTALTNRALMEIASKENLKEALKEGKVYKTNMTSDELHEQHGLIPMKQLCPVQNSVMLSTFFISSGFAAETSSSALFDYVIMDEASQAITAMFAATVHMGAKCLIVGDTHQLPPIVALNEDLIHDKNYQPLINGLQLMADSSNLPIYQLTHTYRFGERAANYTGMFYGNSLVSDIRKHVSSIQPLHNILHPCGGPTLVLTDMPLGDAAPKFAIDMATYIVGSTLQADKSKEIAVLTCMIKTTKALQKTIANSIESRNNVIIETVARVQGLTTDVVVYFIPNVSYLRTIEPHLFNVATSRAREHTIIIADKNILNCREMNGNVRQFLSMLKKEQSFYIPCTENSNLLLI